MKRANGFYSNFSSVGAFHPLAEIGIPDRALAKSLQQRMSVDSNLKKELTDIGCYRLFFANCFANRMAAIMEDGLAIPFPAMS
jgi:hypothetical protein